MLLVRDHFGAQMVRPLSEHVHRAGERDILAILEHFVAAGRDVNLDRLERPQVVGHVLERLDGVGVALDRGVGAGCRRGFAWPYRCRGSSGGSNRRIRRGGALIVEATGCFDSIACRLQETKRQRQHDCYRPGVLAQ
jgi:hypothetical protein